MGLMKRQPLDQAHRIKEINDKIRQGQSSNIKTTSIKENKTCSNQNNFRILSAAEVNILKNGSLDISNNVLDKLDVVGGAIHSNFAQPIEVQTDRLVKGSTKSKC